MSPRRRFCSNATPKSREATGSCIYQLHVIKMRLFPYSQYYVANDFVGKVKRKASEDVMGSHYSPTKQVSETAHPLSPEWLDAVDDNAMEVIWGLRVLYSKRGKV